jgi:hypothetical protein
MPSAKRSELWISANGLIPEGMRLGNTCHVQYCGKLEHMVLVENKNHGRNSWIQYVNQAISLGAGEHFDILDIANDEKTRLQLAAALRGSKEACVFHFAIRSLTKSSGGIRIIKIGAYASYGSYAEPSHEIKEEIKNKFPLLIQMSKVRPWQRPSSVWMGQFFNPANPSEYRKPPLCKVAGCVFPVFRGTGDYCYHHNHWFDYPISMTDNKIDKQGMFRASEPYSPYTLAAEFLVSTANLEKSLKVQRDGYTRHDHKNSGSDKPQVIKNPSTPNYSRSNGRLRMRSSGGCHSSSKTTRGRARAASRQGKGGRHSTKEKRWTRETIESLERQADAILGEHPIDCAVNFIPPDEREDGGEEYERDEIISELEGKSDFERLFGA